MMFELLPSKNQIIIKRNSTFLGLCVVATIMTISGIQLLFDILPLGVDYTFADMFGLIFICVWIVVVLSMLIFAFSVYRKQIIINGDGVLCKSWINKRFMKWSNIKDWGLSYCGQTRRKGNAYYLYFSEHECQNKCEYKKRLKGKMIKTFVIGDDYFDAVSKIVPFCKDQTEVVPFISKDIYHVI